MKISSIRDLKQISNKIKKKLTPGDVVFLYGEIGVGKTTFARLLINNYEKEKKLKESEVLSPTFNIVFEYDVKEFTIKHYDFYRLKSDIDIKNIGLFEDLKKISGQMPIATKTKKAIANFKTKEDMIIGCKVTLRKKRMYEFIDRLINIALPRIRDFRGLSANGFDQFGNYTLGIKEHIIFPEVNFDRVDKIRGLDITIVISSINKDHSYELLSKLNFPFIKKGDN